MNLARQIMRQHLQGCPYSLLSVQQLVFHPMNPCSFAEPARSSFTIDNPYTAAAGVVIRSPFMQHLELPDLHHKSIVRM